MNRNLKLSKLDDKAKSKLERDKAERLLLLDKFSETVDSLKDTLGDGIDINGLDDLLGELENLNTIRPMVSELKQVIESIKIPELPSSVEVKGLGTLLKAMKEVNKAEVKVDLKPLALITNKLDSINKAIDKAKVPEQGQKPTDFVPMRRVMLIGKKLLFDDTHWNGGGGGGSSFPQDIIENDRIKISNGTLVPETYDYIAMSYPNDTSEVAIYKLNGASGITVATVTTTYTDSTKELISTIART